MKEDKECMKLYDEIMFPRILYYFKKRNYKNIKTLKDIKKYFKNLNKEFI
jgi:hypothetical protein